MGKSRGRTITSARDMHRAVELSLRHVDAKQWQGVIFNATGVAVFPNPDGTFTATYRSTLRKINREEDGEQPMTVCETPFPTAIEALAKGLEFASNKSGVEFIAELTAGLVDIIWRISGVELELIAVAEAAKADPEHWTEALAQELRERWNEDEYAHLAEEECDIQQRHDQMGKEHDEHMKRIREEINRS